MCEHDMMRAFYKKFFGGGVWGFRFAPSKPKKGEKWTDSRRPHHRASAENIHHRLSLDIDIARADASVLSTRPPQTRATRALYSRDSTFLLGDVFAVRVKVRAFPFRVFDVLVVLMMMMRSMMAFQSKAKNSR